jgi:hypothetical protein
MNPPSRIEIEKFANERFQADLERRINEYALKQAQALAQVRSRGNSGGFLPALIQCKQEKLRAEILALADAWVEAGTIYAVPLQVWAEEALEKAAVLMAAGTVSALRGELDRIAKKTRNPQNETGAGNRAIEGAMRSALREGKLRLKTQRIQAGRWLGDLPASGLQSGTKPPKLSSVAGRKPESAASITGKLPRDALVGGTKPGSTEPTPAQGKPSGVANGADRGGASWQDIEISFLSDELVQIRSRKSTETRNYGELEFADRRAKRGKPKPN